VASAVATAPWLAVISRHKNWMFALSGALLALNYWLVVVRPEACAPGEICHMDSPLMRFNRLIFWVSAAVYASALVLTYGSAFYLERI
jgi:hypothetical protein